MLIHYYHYHYYKFYLIYMFKIHTNQSKLVKTNPTKPNQIVKQGLGIVCRACNFRTLLILQKLSSDLLFIFASKQNP